MNFNELMWSTLQFDNSGYTVSIEEQDDITIWNTSEPSSKSTMAKKILLVNALEYRQEFARIWYSSSACL